MKTLTLQEAADMLHVCTETVSECIRAQGLPAAKIGRAWVLVDEDVINWLRQRYKKGEECGSTNEASAGSGGLTPRSQAKELREALAPRADRRRRNGLPNLQVIPGAPADSENVRP